MKKRTPRGSSKHTSRKCFISAPFGCDVTLLVQFLKEQGIRPRRLDSLRGNQSITSSLIGELKKSDFVCAVFVSGFEISSTLFELGIAIGQGKPTIILAEPNLTLPLDIAALPIGRISLKNLETIKVAVIPQLKNVEKTFRKRVSFETLDRSYNSHHAKELGPTLDIRDKLLATSQAYEPPETLKTSCARLSNTFLASFNVDEALEKLKKIRDLPQPEKGKKFAAHISALFEQVGIQAERGDGANDQGVDLAIWLNDVSRVLSNPILAELKIQLDFQSWQQAAKTLLEYMAIGRSQCGLLITLDDFPPDVPRFTRSFPMVVTLPARELINLLAAKSLGKELIKARNQAVHG